MIKNIEMVNVKGQTTRQELTGRDVIIGRNGAGKTTRLQTIGLAMLGYVPGKGKTLADTFKLASAEEMAVGLETDNFSLNRTFTKTKKLNKHGETEVKISQKLSISPSMGETTNTQKEQRIKQEMGDLPIMLDFGSFIAMTDNQQRDFIYNLSGNGVTWDRDRVEQEMKATLLEPKMETVNKDLYDCMEENINETMQQYKEESDVQAGILAMSEYAKEKLRHWKKEKINADGAAKKLTELKNRGEQTDRDLTINIEKLKELQAKKESIIQEMADLTARNKDIERKEEELNKLREDIASLEVVPDKERSETLAEEMVQQEVKIAELQATKTNLDEQEKILQNNLATYQSDKNTLSEQLLILKAEIATINAEIKANGDLLQRIQDNQGCCAFSPNIPCNQDFSDFITETNNIMDEAYDKKDEIEHNIDATEKTLEENQEKIRDTQAKQGILDEEKRELANTMAKTKEQLEQKNAELSELENREPMLAVKRQQEAEIAAYINENQKVDLTAIGEHRTLIEAQIEQITATIDEQKKIRNDILNIKANIIDSQTAELNVLSWNEIANALGQKGIKGSLMKEMLNPLLEDVNAKLHGIGISENFYFATNSDTGKEVFEFGWGEKPFEALSTGEQLLLMTALMTTMIEKANPPIKVLAIDNINDLDRHNLSLVLNGLNTIGQEMNNIILAGVVEPTDEDTAGWHVWNL